MAQMIYSLTDSLGVQWQTLMVQAPQRDYWMVPHDRMRYSYDNKDWRLNPNRNGLAREASRIYGTMPEVYRVKPEHATPLSIEWQQLLCDINFELDPAAALKLLNTGLAWCNNDYGVFDFPRLCGGAVVTGRTGGGFLFVSSYLSGDPVPSASEMLADPTTWYYGTGVQPDGDINFINRLGKDGQEHPVRMFIVSREPLYIPLDELLYLGNEYPGNYDPREMR